MDRRPPEAHMNGVWRVSENAHGFYRVCHHPQFVTSTSRSSGSQLFYPDPTPPSVHPVGAVPRRPITIRSRSCAQTHPHQRSTVDFYMCAAFVMPTMCPLKAYPVFVATPNDNSSLQISKCYSSEITAQEIHDSKCFRLETSTVKRPTLPSTLFHRRAHMRTRPLPAFSIKIGKQRPLHRLSTPISSTTL